MPQPNAVRCLVVDDEPRLRRVLVRLLEGEGFTCSEAGSGTEALEMMHHEPVPLVISDLRMPQMDGVTLLREILARWPDTAVIVVTAVAEVESAVACLQLGALDYVAKPFHLDEVRARVMQALDKRRLILENFNHEHEFARGGTAAACTWSRCVNTLIQCPINPALNTRCPAGPAHSGIFFFIDLTLRQSRLDRSRQHSLSRGGSIVLSQIARTLHGRQTGLIYHLRRSA